MNISLVHLSDQRRQIAIQVVRITLWVVMLAICIGLLLFALSEPPPGADLHARHIRFGMSALIPLGAAIGLGLLSRGLLVPAISLLAVMLYAAPMTAAIIVGLGVHSMGMALWPVVIMLLGFAWGTAAAVGVSSLFVASIVGLTLAELARVLPGPTMATLGGPIFFGSVLFLAVVLVCWLTVRYSGVFLAALEAAARSSQELESSNLALRQSENSLQERNQQLRAILDATTEGIFHVDSAGTILAINATAAHRLQQEPEELIGKCAFEFFPPEVSTTRRADMAEVLQTGQKKVVEDTRADRLFSLNYYPVPGKDGITESLVVFALDITDRKRTEAQALTLAQRMQLLMKTATDGIHILDDRGNVIETNDAFCRLLGYTQDELSHMNYADWDAHWSSEELSNRMQEFLATGRGVFETRHRRKDGTLIPVEISASAVELDGHQFIYAAARDITERKHNQQRLEHLLAEQKAILENDLVGIVTVRDRKIVWANPGFEKMLGYGPGELAGTPTRKNYPSDDAYLAFGAAAYPTLTAGRVFRSQIEHVRKDGKPIWVDLSGSILDQESGESLWGFVDITERRMLEQRIAQNEQRMELALDGAELGLWDLDIPSGKFSHNARLVTMGGYALGEVEVTAKTFASLLHPDDAARFGSAFYANLKGEATSFQAEYRVRHKDDYWIWILSRGKVVERDHNGRAIRMTGTNLDISERKRSEAVLKAREARLSTLIASMQDMVIVLDTSGTVVEYFHPSFSYRPSYKPREQMIGKTYTEILPADVAGIFDEAIAGIMSDGQPQTVEYTFIIDDKEFISVARVSPIAGEAKYPTGFLIVVRDVTSERASQKELERLGKSNALLLESVGEGIYGVDLANHATFVNSSAMAMLGFTEAEILGQEQHALFHHHRSDGTPYPGDECPIRRTLEDGQLRRVENEWFWRKDGSGFPVALTITPIVENDRRVGVVVIFQDTTERMADEAKIRDLAFYDPLTRLPNRRLLLDRLEQTMAASQRSGCYGALMFLDLDNFKPLNDTHGHAIGDMLLVEAANRLKGCVREVDTVARFGGDEFVVLLGELSADRAATTSQAELIAEKIRNALSAPYRLTITREGAADATVEHRCTATIGVALFINHEMSQDEILTKADDAMYQAKEAGRNRVQFSAAKFLRSAGSETVSANFVQLTWRPAYRSGNPLIDEQHRALLSDANSLLTAILSTRPTAEVAALIDVLIGDIVEHFKDEEAIILAAGFPGTEQHAAIHRELVDRAGNLVGRFHAGTLGVGDLFEFLANDVIAQHMLGADREYFSYMEKRH